MWIAPLRRRGCACAHRKRSRGRAIGLLIAASLLVAAPRSSAAPRGPRHYVEISQDLPAEPITAVAVDPRDDDIILVGLDGFVFKTDDGGESFRPVLGFPRGVLGEVGLAAELTDATFGVAGDPSAALPLAPLVDASDAVADPGVDPDAALDDPLVEDPEDADDDRPLGDRETGDDDERPDDGAFETDAISPGGDVLPGASSTDGLDLQDDVLPEGDASLAVASVLPRRGPGVRAIRFVPESPGTVYVATARGLYRSVDRGESFTAIELPGGALANDVRDLAVDPLRPSRLYVATALGLLVSRDGGATYAEAPGRPGEMGALSVAVDASTGETQVLVGTEAGLFRSWDGAASFTELLLKGAPVFEPVTALAFAVDGEITYAGTRTGLFASERRAAILERREGMPADVVLSISPDPVDKRAVAVGFLTTGLALSTDTGITQARPGDEVPAARVPDVARPRKDPDALLVATDRGLFRSAPGTGIRRAPDRLARLRERLEKEPALATLTEDALRYAGVSPSLPRELSARARFAAFLPDLRLRYRLRVGRTARQSLLLLAPGELPPETDPDADRPEDLSGQTGLFSFSPASGVSHAGFLLAEWDLDRLIFDPREAVVLRTAVQLHAGQQHIVDRTRELWAARRRLLAQMAVGSEVPAAKGQIARALKLLELTAQLDGMTGGSLTERARQRGIEAGMFDDVVEGAGRGR